MCLTFTLTHDAGRAQRNATNHLMSAEEGQLRTQSNRSPSTNQNLPLNISHTCGGIILAHAHTLSHLLAHISSVQAEKRGCWFASHIDLGLVYEIVPGAEARDKLTRPTWGYLPTLLSLVSTAECWEMSLWSLREWEWERAALPD